MIHHYIYIILLCLLSMSMTTSVYATNLVWVLLLLNWITEWNWREKFADFRHNYFLQAFLALLAVHILWLLGTENLSYALFDLQKKLPLFVIPLVVLTTPPPNKQESLSIGVLYVTTLLVVTIIGMVRYLTLADLPYREIVPYISHIRFGLNLCLGLFMLLWTAFQYRNLWIRSLCALLSLWFMAFLLLIHSYTALIILIVTSLVLVVAYRNHMDRRLHRITSLTVATLLFLTLGLAGYYCYDYYHLRPLSTQTLTPTTPNGNAYSHRDDGLIENGNYVHHYICKKEMRQEWTKRSDYPFDSCTNGHWSVYPTLLRYLNSMGFTKDSLGMTHLSDRDIAAIEKGIANYVYLEPGPRKMVYVLCYEFENYRCYHSVRDFSMLQRIELWRNGFQIFLQHPLFGVGTGDVPDACQARLETIDSPLASKHMHTHNQYLNFLLAFGLVGFAIILFFFVRAVVRTHSCRRFLFTAFLCIFLISCISEDTLETLAGITFTALFLSLLSTQVRIKN